MQQLWLLFFYRFAHPSLTCTTRILLFSLLTSSFAQGQPTVTPPEETASTPPAEAPDQAFPSLLPETFFVFLDPLETTVSSSQTTYDIEVRASEVWTATESAEWIQISPAPGTAYGFLTVSVAENPINRPREAEISIGPETHRIIQEAAPPRLTISPVFQTTAFEEANYTVAVSANRQWEIIENIDWISVTPESGDLDGEVEVTVSANPSLEPRNASILIGGLDHQINQNGIPKILEIDQVDRFLDPTPESYVIAVTANHDWQVLESVDWVRLDQTSGFGNGTVQVTVLENVLPSSRSTTLLFNDVEHTLTQGPAEPPQYTVTANAEPEAGGFVIGLRNESEEDTITLIASPSEGFLFVGWTLDGQDLGGAGELTLEVVRDFTVVANFQLAQEVTDPPPDGTPPLITQSVFPSTIWEGRSTLFSVSAVGTAPIQYQWSKNGAVIPGATEPNLRLPNTTLEDSATYSVLLLNPFGSAEAGGTLTVRERPADPGPSLFPQFTRFETIPGEVWIYEDWVGFLYLNPFPWVFSELHGWLYVVEIDPSGNTLTAYHPSLGWVWLSQAAVRQRPDLPPQIYLWSFREQSWLYFGGLDTLSEEGQDSIIVWYYRFSSGTWISVAYR